MIALSCVSSDESHNDKLMEIVNSYRKQIFSSLEEKDSLFYTIVFFETDSTRNVLVTANDVELSGFMVTPSSKKPSKDPFIGYSKYNNNFLFYYSVQDCDFYDYYVDESCLKKKIDDKNLLRYNTNDWNIDTPIWIYIVNEDYTLRKDK